MQRRSTSLFRAILLLGLGLGLGAPAAQARDAALLERGKYLMNGVVACGNCHMARGEQGQPLFEKGLSGGMVFDEQVFKAMAPNITPDPETGIGKWTDAQLAKAIREGVRPDKSIIGPPMPIEMYRHISDRDLAALIAYMREQPPIRNAVAKSTYAIPLPPNYGPALVSVAAPSSNDKLKTGEYLVRMGHCMECHTPRSQQGRLEMDKLGAGGQTFKGPWGESVARNLTSHANGLKDWSDAQIAKAVREGVDRQGKPYKPPMAYGFYRSIKDEDMAAMIAYLRSLTPMP
ncbi:cytochrome c [Paucibacter sp. TC2R-5]|uniref:c-type cytochrome n=1 Tax=Paucibacter sp. TC2R-5 TaxID=2893555 RepID=UPI0021E3E1B2|nr:cytochrome c [Paucibacter sp. TC2R-5]MCV2358614.1 cytochrome c [Paucibacter sp. TC2R-5]